MGLNLVFIAENSVFFYLESVMELDVIPSSRYGAKMDTVLLFTFSLSFKYM